MGRMVQDMCGDSETVMRCSVAVTELGYDQESALSSFLFATYRLTDEIKSRWTVVADGIVMMCVVIGEST